MKTLAALLCLVAVAVPTNQVLYVGGVVADHAEAVRALYYRTV